MIDQQESEDVQSFERRSSTYEDSILQGLFIDRFQRVALDSVPAEIRPESILDIGCGTGRLLRKAAARWPTAHLIGVDPADGMVKVGRGLNTGAKFYISPAEALPLPDASVDLVFSTLSFHHWYDQAQGVKEVGRVLQPGGIFVLVDIYMPYGLEKKIRHGRQVNPSVMGKIFALAGLNILTQQWKLMRFLLVTTGWRTKTRLN